LLSNPLSSCDVIDVTVIKQLLWASFVEKLYDDDELDGDDARVSGSFRARDRRKSRVQGKGTGFIADGPWKIKFGFRAQNPETSTRRKPSGLPNGSERHFGIAGATPGELE